MDGSKLAATALKPARSEVIDIDLILHTPGGLVLVARTLIRHPAKVTAVVPHYAMSGGTMLALTADFFVDANALLGPADP